MALPKLGLIESRGLARAKLSLRALIPHGLSSRICIVAMTHHQFIATTADLLFRARARLFGCQLLLSSG